MLTAHTSDNEFKFTLTKSNQNSYLIPLGSSFILKGANLEIGKLPSYLHHTDSFLDISVHTKSVT